MIRLIFLLVIISYSCSPAAVVSERPSVSPVNTYSQDSLYIHLTGGFKNDSLIIEYADVRIIEPDITTGDHGFAKAKVIPSKGTDRIHVSLIRPDNRYLSIKHPTFSIFFVKIIVGCGIICHASCS